MSPQSRYILITRQLIQAVKHHYRVPEAIWEKKIMVLLPTMVGSQRPKSTMKNLHLQQSLLSKKLIITSATQQGSYDKSFLKAKNIS